MGAHAKISYLLKGAIFAPLLYHKGVVMWVEKYQKKNGETCWRGKVYVGINPLTGKEQIKKMSGFKKRRDLIKALADYEHKITEGKHTYQEVYEAWLDLYKKKVKESTYLKTTRMFERHILPKIGAYYIDAITLSDLQPIATQWGDEFVNANVHREYMSSVFDEAVRLGYIDNNPCQHLVVNQTKKKKTKVKKKDKKMFLEKEELEQVLDKAKEIDEQAYVMIRVLAYTGLRRGELLALTWKDLSNGSLSVNKGLAYGLNGVITQTPKTEKSYRSVELDKTTLSILNAWRIEQTKRFGICSLMFCNHQKKHLSMSYLGHKLDKIFKELDVSRVSTHALRHTHVAVLSELGVDIGAIQKRLGHSNISTTMDIYHHVTKKTNEELIEKLSNY